MPFQPGQSGNPSGARTKSPEQREFEAKCREWCRLFAFDKLKRAVDSADPKRQDWALEAMLNRAFGKPVETSVVDAAVTSQSGSSVEELNRKAAELLGFATGSGPSVDGADRVDGGERAATPVPAEPGASPVHSGDSAGGAVHSD